MQSYPIIDRLHIDSVAPGKIARYWLEMATTALCEPVKIPVMIARGLQDGPVLGITAALHGNELNGIPVIQTFMQDLNVQQLRGTVVGVPVLNVPSFLENQRIFTDDTDLNRIMPGKSNGNESHVYAHRLLDRLLTHFQYHIDFHTASAGRVNSHYVRANMKCRETAMLARVQNPEIILNSVGEEGALRPFLAEHGIFSITVELCDPHIIQMKVIRRELHGMHNTLVHLGMLSGDLHPPKVLPVECDESFWMYTDRGGWLEVLPKITDSVSRGDLVARLSNIFGDVIHEYHSPADGIVIGKSVNPVNQTGGRILHLGLLKK